uniref:Uncharacterized protein n=1 Tax=Mycena chlorophos TaxID=658473 RepID=A0ABQ0M1Y4_MYCCL|nr:predicted protein [Mycena chlorophos]
MPVVVKPKPEVVGTNTDFTFTSARDILSAASTAWAHSKVSVTKGYFEQSPYGSGSALLAGLHEPIAKERRHIMSSSFTGNDGPVAPYGGGFVHCVTRAFQQDLHLVIRPEDFWQAILTQFSFFVVGHAEELRHQFVAHQGQEKVVVDLRPLSLEDLPPGLFARLMVKEMQKKLLDPDLSDWFLPSFTTTTQTDVATASITMMATMKQYFKYILLGGCGFPSVTLLGERADWEDILRRIGKLPQYGAEPATWAALLTVIVQRILGCFDDPDSDAAKSFWMSAVHEAGAMGSGNTIESLSGWLTALCFWDDEGRRIPDLASPDASNYLRDILGPDQVPLVLDGVQFPLILPNKVPSTAAKVEMTYLDYGRRMKVLTELVAGHVGASVGAAGNTLQPCAGWWVLKTEEEPM